MDFGYIEDVGARMCERARERVWIVGTHRSPVR